MLDNDYILYIPMLVDNELKVLLYQRDHEIRELPHELGYVVGRILGLSKC